jgi:hypothetical protein
MQVSLTFQRREQDREQRLEALGADAPMLPRARSAPGPDGLVLQSRPLRPERRLRLCRGGSVQERDGVFAVIPGQRDAFIEDPALPIGCAGLIPIRERSHQLLPPSQTDCCQSRLLAPQSGNKWL